MEANNQVIDLKQRQKEIKKLKEEIKKEIEHKDFLETSLEKQIEKIENGKNNLEKLNNQYYCDFFDKERKIYTKLTNIPYYKVIDGKTNPIRKYSLFNLEELGDIFVDFIKYKYRCKAKSKIEVIKKEEYKRDDNYYYHFSPYDCEYPYLIINSSKININVPFTDFVSSNLEKSIKCCNDDKFLYYSYYNKLLRSGYSSEFTFNYQNNESIRELIYNLAYYQKQINETQLPEGQLLKAYKKIYKR